jgi:hypothetical protein
MWGPSKQDHISDCFANTEGKGQARNEELLREVLDFLRKIELIERYSEDGREKVYRVMENSNTGEHFQLLLLRQFQRFSDGRDAFRVCYQWALNENKLFLSKEDLLKILERNAHEGYAWNMEKLRTWENLAIYTGLVRSVKPSQGDLMISPTPELLGWTMLAYQANQTETNELVKIEIPAGDWLDFVEEHYFSVHTSRNHIAEGISASLLAMEKRKLLEFSTGSDAPHSILLGQRRVSWIKLVPDTELTVGCL